MKILITGATGLVGKKLIQELIQSGYEDIRVLTRSKKNAKLALPLPLSFYEWDPDKATIDKDAFEGIDVIYHLAGENIASARWSKKQKDKILDSRVKSTKLIVDTINELEVPLKKLICASAIGIYGNTQEAKIYETSELATDFLATVCKSWEKESSKLENKDIKVHNIRTGIVLSTEGGALAKMLPAFNLGIAGILGSGKQYMSWIHIDDLVGIYIHLLKNDIQDHIINATAPNPVTNKVFTKTLGKVLSRPTILPAPALALKIALGELSCLLLQGQRVYPRVITKSFSFKYEQLEKALEELLKSKSFKKIQWLNKPVDEVFDYFSSEKNLEEITPESLKFKVLKMSTDNIQTGTIIDYKLQLYGVPFKWKTQIKDFKKNNSFVDIQLKGPYKKWEHTHKFFPYKNGTLIADSVEYKVPLGGFGDFIAGAFIRRDINKIFNYRSKKLSEVFDITKK